MDRPSCHRKHALCAGDGRLCQDVKLEMLVYIDKCCGCGCGRAAMDQSCKGFAAKYSM
jgi:hypothetical protein